MGKFTSVRHHLKVPALRSGGFTLLELMVAISISAILLTIAIPSYKGVIISNRLTSAANGFVGAINVARLEAIRRNITSQFCAASNNGADTLGGVCGTTAGAVYALQSDGVTTNKIYDAVPVSSDLGLTATTALRFNGQGLATAVGATSPAYTGLLIDLSSSKISANNHRCIYITAGSTISTCSYTTTSGGCPTSEPSNCQ